MNMSVLYVGFDYNKMKIKLLKQDKEKSRLSQVIFSKQGVGGNFRCNLKVLIVSHKKALCKLKINNGRVQGKREAMSNAEFSM